MGAAYKAALVATLGTGAYISYTRIAPTSGTRARRLHLVHAHGAYISYTRTASTFRTRRGA
jgi:hypothetical protein